MDAVNVLYPGAVATAENPVNMNPIAPLLIGPWERRVHAPLDWSATRFAGHLGDANFAGGAILDTVLGLALKYAAFTGGVAVANMLQHLKMSTGQVLLAGGIAAGVGLAVETTLYGVLGAFRGAQQ